MFGSQRKSIKRPTKLEKNKQTVRKNKQGEKRKIKFKSLILCTKTNQIQITLSTQLQTALFVMFCFKT